MRSIVKALGISAALAMLVSFSAPAQAAPIVSIVPDSVTVNTSTTLTVGLDVYVTGLTEQIGGYSLDIVWDFGVMNWTFGDYDPADNFDNIFFLPPDTSVPGALLGGLIAGDPINGNNGTTDPLRLAHFDFVAQGPLGFQGQTNVDLLNVHLSKLDGQTDIAGVTSVGGVVCFARLTSEVDPYTHDEACQRSVPEPAMMSLVAAGLAGLVARRRAAKRS